MVQLVEGSGITTAWDTFVKGGSCEVMGAATIFSWLTSSSHETGVLVVL